MLSFGLVALVTLFAVGLGLHAFGRIESAFEQVTTQRVPEMARASQMVELTVRLSSHASVLVAAQNPSDLHGANARIDSERHQIQRMVQQLGTTSIANDQLDKLQHLTEAFLDALNELQRRTRQRLKLEAERPVAVAEVDDAHKHLKSWVVPKIDDANFELIVQAEDATDGLSRQIEALTSESISLLEVALTLRAAVNQVSGVMIEALVARNRGVLEAAADRFLATRMIVEQNLGKLPPDRASEDISGQITSLIGLGDRIFATRRESFENGTAGSTQFSNSDLANWSSRIYEPRELALTALEPIIDDANFNLMIQSEAIVEDGSSVINNLIGRSVEELRAYLSLAADGNLLAGLLRQASIVQDSASLAPLSDQIKATTEHLRRHKRALDDVDVPTAELATILERIFARADGAQSLVALRATELQVLKQQHASFDRTLHQAALLAEADSELVESSRDKVVMSSQSVYAAITGGRWLMAILSLTVLVIIAVIVSRERVFRRRLESSARELQDHRDHLQDLVEARTETISQQAEELKRALDAEKELNGLQRQFVSMVSHEFRTPLAIIDGNAQRLIRRNDTVPPDKRKDSLGKIRTSVTRLTELMESVLDAARLEGGELKFEPSACDLRDMVREAGSNYVELNPNHKLLVDIDRLPSSFVLDTKLIRQVLSNLLSNAFKYSPKGGNVSISGQQTADGSVELSVRDQGVGIPAEELQKLFTRFFRASTSVGIAGTGIGLHMVQAVVDLHGGSIHVDSQEGEGTTFTVTLPKIANPGSTKDEMAA